MTSRPTVFYHASQNRNIEILEPRGLSSPHNFEHGPVVWGTPNFSFVTLFIIPDNDNITRCGAINETCYMIVGDREEYLSRDEGGAIYFLPPEGFVQFNRSEWFNKNSVKPTKKLIYNSGIKAMLENGVQVFFPESDIFSSIQAGADHLDILRTLESENKRLGINYKPFGNAVK